MKTYLILKVTNGGEYLIGMRSALKDAINRAKTIVKNADIAPAAYQRIPKDGIKDGFFYISIRLLQNQYEINAEIWKTDIYYEQTIS